MTKVIKMRHPVISQLEKAVSEGRPYDHDLEGDLGQYVGKTSSEVADKVIETLYGKNGDGVPYFVEKLAPHIGLDTKKLDKEAVDKIIAEYGILKEPLKNLITSSEKFDAATISRITTQLASQLVADLIKTIPGQIGNLAYRDRDAAVEAIVNIQKFLRGENGAANTRMQLKNALTPDRIQAVATGVVDNAYAAVKESTPNLYNLPDYKKAVNE